MASTSILKPKHKQIWFIHRIGKFVIRNCIVDLFNPLIKIESIHRAKALYISQSEKNYTYKEIK